LEKEVAWLYFYGTCKSCFVLLQEGLYLVLISPFYNHALLGCDVGWEWTRHWVWADGWVSGGCREYSMSYLNSDVFFFLKKMLFCMLEIPLYFATYIYIDYWRCMLARWCKSRICCLSTNHVLAFDGLPISFAFDDPISIFLRRHVN
jgi:hypothetical protein